ncbi:MAG: hypothetical protein V4534_04710 [Myxococcota bacterium]
MRILILAFLSSAAIFGQADASSEPLPFKSAANKWGISTSILLDVSAMWLLPLPALEAKVSIPLGRKWQLTVPVRMYAFDLPRSWIDTRDSSQIHCFDISSGIGIRKSWTLFNWRRVEMLYFLEPSLRAGYYSYYQQGGWIGGYVQHGILMDLFNGLTFGVGGGLSGGIFIKSWPFFNVEFSTTFGYSW